jgi:hypothetical protein
MKYLHVRVFILICILICVLSTVKIMCGKCYHYVYIIQEDVLALIECFISVNRNSYSDDHLRPKNTESGFSSFILGKLLNSLVLLEWLFKSLCI